MPGQATVMLAAGLPWAVFVSSLAAGYAYPSYSLVESFSEEVASRFSGLDPFSLALLIFINNLSTAALVYVLSMLYVLPGMLLIAFNGYLIGSVVSYALEVEGLSPKIVIAALAPHGVVEIPAFLAASSGGIYYLLRAKGVKERLVKGLSLMIMVAILLAVAALIEAFITPLVVEAVGG